TKLAKKLVQDSRNRKKNTDSSAGFNQNQLESICVFYLPASFCPASFLYDYKEERLPSLLISNFSGEFDGLEQL
ncbi:TPA: hypothetical protein ACGO4J_002062, partial [Streptococcus suis]